MPPQDGKFLGNWNYLLFIYKSALSSTVLKDDFLSWMKHS